MPKAAKSEMLAGAMTATISAAMLWTMPAAAQTVSALDPAVIAAARQHALATVRAMHGDEKTTLTHGIMALPFRPDSPPPPAAAVPGAGYIAGVPRLGVPALTESDASLGVAYVGGARHDGATALPSGLAQAASWNPQVLYAGGRMIGGEARAKGFNVLLAGGVNLMRDPRNGRTFEYFSEDPLLSGMLVGAAIAGIQSNHIISTIKHFALNGQETGRQYVDSRIGEAAARESDLLAFEIGIEQGHPLSVMCSYNLVNGAHACDNDWLLNTILKRDWRYTGFVMSDWGAVPSLDTALHGLDQQSGSQLDKQLYFGDDLAAKARADTNWAARVDDMNARILTAIYAAGLDTAPATPGGAIDFAADAQVAQTAAEQGIVLLKNQGDLLPLTASAKRIAVIGGHAQWGVLSGGGSSQVAGQGGPLASVPGDKESFMPQFVAENYNGSSPLAAIRALAPRATVTYRGGAIIADAVDQARKADIAIVFATKWAAEGFDQADLTLPNGQDALIAAVAAANPHTIVVLETGNPVAMPWLGAVPGVLEAWFPGVKGGEAIADVLFGRANPSGRLPITFPASTAQLPRPVLDGYFETEPDFIGQPPYPGAKLSANYDIEGSDVGYRWFARQGAQPLFPFGYGLTYTHFTEDKLTLDGLHAALTVTNTGAREGADVAQLYLVSRNGAAKQRLVGFQRVVLAPGASQAVNLAIDPRLLADWTPEGWHIAGGTYGFALGKDAAHLGTVVPVHVAARTWRD